ncbi:MAG: NAD-dependent epimerase/dehydratase family protein [Anaerolineae bacterium]|jgi:UDP-glucose 4-epimerase
MRFLITGGAGFIGSALANRLVRDGHHVRVIDDLSAGDPARLLSDVHFARGNVTDKPKLWRLLNKVDCVYHLAARVSVPESILYPREYETTNVGGTVALMEAIRDAGVQRVVLASSGAIYGEQPRQPVTEDMAPRPTSPYAVSKLAAEYYVSTIGSLWGIETVALRIFNAYGPGQAIPPAHAPVIPQFMKQALGGGSLVVFGDGEQTRDFVYIDDVVEALATAAVADGIDRQIINVGSGQETDVNTLVRSIEKVTRHEAQALHIRAESGGVSRLVADLTLARRWLKYEPQVDLEIGLKLLLERDPQFQVAATSSK